MCKFESSQCEGSIGPSRLIPWTLAANLELSIVIKQGSRIENTVAKLTSENSRTQQKNSQTSGNDRIFTKTLIFSLEISRLQLFLYFLQFFLIAKLKYA